MNNRRVRANEELLKEISFLNQRIKELEQSESERKRAEEALRQSEATLRSVFLAAPVGICIMKNRVYQSANAFWCESFGYPEESIIGKGTRMLYESDEEFNRVGQELYHNLLERVLASVETKLRRSDGVFRDVIVVAAPLQDDDITAGTVAIIHDITERKQAEAALNASESRLKSISNNLPSAMIYQVITSPDGTRKFTYLSDSVKQLHGISPEEAIADSSLIFDSVHKDDVAKFLEVEKEAIKTISTFSVEVRVKDPSGGLRWSSLASTPSLMEDGYICWDGIELVITKRKQDEENLKMANVEIRSAHEQLKNKQAQIIQQEKMASIGQLAAGIAHEINNPTSFVYGNLDILQTFVSSLTVTIREQEEILQALAPEETMHELQAKRKKRKLDFIITDIERLIRQSMEGTERIKRIVNDLSRFSRADQQEYSLEDINMGLERTLNIVWNEIKYKAEVRKELGDIPLTVCDIALLSQVFMNLLVNAAHAIEKEGLITLRTWADKANIFIAVGDTGIGIKEENISRIFDAFFTTKESGKGTGLGLSISYEIIKKHNGEIIVASKEGEGTTFTVRVPIVSP